jgi:hypothetical protein
LIAASVKGNLPLLRLLLDNEADCMILGQVNAFRQALIMVQARDLYGTILSN